MRILGVRVNALDRQTALAEVVRRVASRRPGQYITLTNVHSIIEACRSSEFRRVIEDAALSLQDGMPLVWVSRLRGCTADRLSGPDFLLDVCRAGEPLGFRHFFYGSLPGVAEEMVAGLRRSFPGLQVAGVHSPPFRQLTDEEEQATLKMINAAAPDVLWVGLGCPKQERWMYDHRDSLQVPVMLGVGQAFDVYAGRLPRAPRWMREHGLEWLFRLYTEPRRLWRRYLVYNSAFLWLLFLESARLRRFD
jgi:N-acetylglucosaminyldiphosphoundecaprenol N-acetyl-beta-D-mannosaminyltransferase